jgi:small Trp-rich protein
MWFVAIGTLLTVLKAIGWSALDNLSWWWALSPFVCAMLWWAWSDGTGRTSRKAMDKYEERRAERRKRNVENLGMTTGPKKPGK